MQPNIDSPNLCSRLLSLREVFPFARRAGGNQLISDCVFHSKLLRISFFAVSLVLVSAACGYSHAEVADKLTLGIAPKMEGTARPQVHSFNAREIPTLTKVWPTNKVEVSQLCHALLFYGVGPTDLPSISSGELALKALTDEQTAIATFGQSPFVQTRNGLRYILAEDAVFHTYVGETHRDQCLATFAVLGLRLDFPVRLKAHTYSISDLLSESVANFGFDQHEPAWTALAYAKYLPPKKEWVSRFGERTTFSQLTRHLLELDIKRQSCSGTHIFQALVKIDSADRQFAILDEETRNLLDSYLTKALHDVVERQQKDGSWNSLWCRALDNSESQPMSIHLQVLITGHLLEVLNTLDSRRRPSRSVYILAAQWAQQALNSPQIHPDSSWVCPFTHAARTAREILMSQPTNSLSFSNIFHPAE